MFLQKCEICGKKGFADLRSHIRSHKVSWQQYREEYGVLPRSMNIPKSLPEKERIIEEYQFDLVQRTKR